MAYSAPSRNQLSGWVSGSRTRLRLSLMARKPCSRPLVSSLDWGKAAQDSFRASMDGNGSSHTEAGSALSPLVLFSRSAIDIGPLL